MRITITIDVDGQGQVSINAGHETTETAKQEIVTKDVAEPKPKVKPEPKPEVKPEPKPEAKPEPKPEVKPEPEEEPGITLDDIREAAKAKINDHRDEIKAKLTEYGASRITDLSPEYFEDFYVFLSCDLK